MADHHDLQVRVQLRDPPGKIVHRDKSGALDTGQVELPRFPYVQQLKDFTGFEPLLETSGRYVLIVRLAH